MSTNLADLKESRYVISAIMTDHSHPGLDYMDVSIERTRVFLAHILTDDVVGGQFIWVDDINHANVCYETSMVLLEPLMNEAWNVARDVEDISDIVPVLLTTTATSCKTEYETAMATAREQRLRKKYNDMIANEFSEEERQLLNIGVRVTNTED